MLQWVKKRFSGASIEVQEKVNAYLEKYPREIYNTSIEFDEKVDGSRYVTIERLKDPSMTLEQYNTIMETIDREAKIMREWEEADEFCDYKGEDE